MKRLIAVLLVLLTVLTVSGCSGILFIENPNNRSLERVEEAQILPAD